MSDSLELYVYTTKSYENRGFLKVGHCKRGRHLERIAEQFGTSNPEPPIVRYVADLPAGKTDRHIHQQLTSNGIKKVEASVGQEWFVAILDDIKRAFNEVCFGSSRVESYRPRKEQQAAVEKAIKWYGGHYSEHITDGAVSYD